jgi:hypothetical protein
MQSHFIAVVAFLALPSCFTPNRASSPTEILQSARRAPAAFLYAKKGEKNDTVVVWRPCATTERSKDCKLPADASELTMPLDEFLTAVPLDTGPYPRLYDGIRTSRGEGGDDKIWFANALDIDRARDAILKDGLAAGERRGLSAEQLLLPFFVEEKATAWRVMPDSRDQTGATSSCNSAGMRLLSLADLFGADTVRGASEKPFVCERLPDWVLRDIDKQKTQFSGWLADSFTQEQGVALYVANGKDRLCAIRRIKKNEQYGIICVL